MFPKTFTHNLRTIGRILMYHIKRLFYYNRSCFSTIELHASFEWIAVYVSKHASQSLSRVTFCAYTSGRKLLRLGISLGKSFDSRVRAFRTDWSILVSPRASDTLSCGATKLSIGNTVTLQIRGTEFPRNKLQSSQQFPR